MSFSRRLFPLLRQTARRQFTSKTIVVDRELPKPPPPSRKRWLWTGAAVGAAVWVVGLGGALNHQRLSSSVVHGTLFMVRYDPRVIALIGDRVDYADAWPWISGNVNHLKGKIDIGFKVKGSTGETARVHFASKRAGNKWNTIEFTVVRESDQKQIDIGNHTLTETGEPKIA
ncbi:cytochrome oxidase complex assembly protein 1-domain-containing protein [Gilbertella persicaria]|uniref:cytochrome oxidase complex assembly protein 1-domain-containing protein n=1 Tax=Gilbertella persicaria TaxID=101096 RepID=UPI0022212340|nr:cytochrome oxidase complex assembly protein 1-domain-containing protein [Gilbertella persicaria]KAI8082482.1 cytochrome oxidase complex assembly protein 1-domain-containing protein [Gilbertella persicaria]